MKRIVSIIAAALAVISAWAQPSIRVEVHNIVELQERFNVGFVVEGENSPSSFEWEAGDDFTVVWGPQKGSSTSIQIINGKTTRSSQTTYTYILQAKKTGTFTLPPATARIKGAEIQSKAVQIQVVGSGASSGAQSSGQQQSQGSSAQASRGDSDIFMRLSLSRNSVVVGEPVTATLKIYHRANLAGFENVKFPSFKGFWSQEVEAPANIEFQREQVDGVMYNSAVLRRWVIIPQKAGEQPIEPAEVVCLVNVQRPRGSGSPFDDFFGTGYVTTRQRVTTPARSLSVSALPSGAPASFAGGVGQFKVSAKVSKDSLKTHDAASLIVTVSGKGNIALVEAPKLSFPPDFEVYDVKTSVNTDKSGTSGSKTFEYPFIPRSPGDFTLGPVNFAYYDVNARRYETVSSAALPISVARSASYVQDGGSSASGNTLVVDRKGVKSLDEDIRFIRTKTALQAGNNFLVYSKAWWGTIIALILLGLGFWLGFRKVAARRADVAGTRNRKATRQALKRLSQAREFLGKNLYTAFYEELHRSLLGFVGDKLGLDMAEQSKENISAALVSGGVAQGVADDFVDLLSACEEARYSPSAGHDAMNAHYEKAVSLITAIDSSMKKKPSSGAGAAVMALLLLVPFGAAQAAESYPDSLWRSGVEAYTAGDYASALKDFEDVRETGLMSKELYYNLGNAYLRSGEIAQAILWYERACRLDPSDADIRYNLEYARALTQDRIDEVPEVFFRQWRRGVCYLLPSNAWAVIGLVSLALFVACVLLFLLGSTGGRRKLGFFVGIAFLVVALLGWDFAQWQRSEALRQDMAIVMKPVSSVKSSPSADGAKDLFILHEGTRVRILDNVGGFSNIELADGRQGWIPAGEIEVI